jgi:dTDP-4-amino-4,6-dideoxygalactose transaminase
VNSNAATHSALRVPLVDLAPQTRAVRAQVLADFGELCETNAFINGSVCPIFEEAFAVWVGAAQAVGVASGTDALRLGLLAHALEPGSEVICPANTFVATVEAIRQAGLTPRLVDARDDDYTIDLEAAESLVGPRTSAIMLVHLYGQMADTRTAMRIAERHGLLVFEDACQAHGAVRDGVRAGAALDGAAFSFYPGKNLGAFGDAGAWCTNDPDAARVVRALREHGQYAKYQHAIEGYTARLDTLQAVVLLHKLSFVDQWTRERRAAAAYYDEALADVDGVVLPHVPDGSDPVWHLYVVRTADPDAFCAALAERGIATGRHYPIPVHQTEAYRHLGREGAFPVTERLAGEIVSLPMFPGIAGAQLAAVCDAVRSAL